MSHLGDLAAALVDGVLSHDERDRALAHVAGCAACRDELEAQRAAKAALSLVPEPAPSAELLARLAAIPTPVVSVKPLSRRARRATPARSRRAAAARAALSMVSAAATIAGVGLLLDHEPGEGVRPPVSTFVQDHTATTDQLPLNDPAAGFVLTSFSP